MEEIWADIEGFVGRYQVSNLGRVRAVFRQPVRLLSPRSNNGYLFVLLYDGRGGRRELRVNRLVAAAFCFQPEGCNVVNHLNFVPSDNRASNLEWTTQRGNIRYSIEHGRYIGRRKKLSV